MTAGSWPAVEVLMIPGRSTTVRSGTSGDDSLTLMVSVEKLFEVLVRLSVKRSNSWDKKGRVQKGRALENERQNNRR